MTFDDLKKLREKATQGVWVAESGEDAKFIAAIVNFFDLPSTQAMLEAGDELEAWRKYGKEKGLVVGYFETGAGPFIFESAKER